MDRDARIAWYAKSALNGFEDLDIETAAANARSDLKAILRLLAADDAVGILLVTPVDGVAKPTPRTSLTGRP